MEKLIQEVIDEDPKRIYYKIMDLENGDLKWLFHGNNGTRTAERYTWIKAQQRPEANDGTSKPTYRSGFHVLETKEQAIKYLRKFKHLENRVIVKCNITGERWKKEHSPATGLWLAEYIMVREVVLFAKFIDREEN